MRCDELQLAAESMSKRWFSIEFSAIVINTNIVTLWNTAKSTGVIKLYIILANGIDMALSFLLSYTGTERNKNIATNYETISVFISDALPVVG